jgi:hypothetical protein
MRYLLSLAIVMLFAGTSPAAETGELQPIFNGKDLTGWRVSPANNLWWKVVDGVLVGEHDEKLRGSMLYTEKSYQDVLFETEVRFPDDIDSGIMMRRPEIQFQIGVSRSLRKDMTCSVYARGKYTGIAEGVDKLLKPNDWNTMRIRAQGSKFTVWLNGQQVLEYEDPLFPNAGPIGLQIHSNVKMKVEFRNIRLKELE